MTPDDYTTAARAEAETFVRKAMEDAWTDGEEFDHLPRILAERLPEWARVYLSRQESTDAEVLAAVNADYAIRHPHSEPADTLDDYGDWHVDMMRAALRAARGVRGQA